MSVAKEGKVFEPKKLLIPLLDTSEGTKITWITLFLTSPTPTVYSSVQSENYDDVPMKMVMVTNEKGNGDDDSISVDNSNDHNNCDNDFNEAANDNGDDANDDDDEREVCKYNAQMQSYILCGLPEQCITLS